MLDLRVRTPLSFECQVSIGGQETLLELKKRICKLTRIPVRCQRLFNNTQLLEDDQKNVSLYIKQSPSELLLQVRSLCELAFTVKHPNGKFKDYTLEGIDYVYDLVKEVTQDFPEYKAMNGRLSYNNEILVDDKALQYYPFYSQKDNTIFIVYNIIQNIYFLFSSAKEEFNITITVNREEICKVTVKIDDTILDLKNKIQQNSAQYKVQMQTLVYFDKNLENGKTIRQSDISENASIILIPTIGQQ